MKIILLEDIPHLGVAGDVVDVKRGYAVNYLLKNDRSIRATKENLERLEEIREEQSRIQAENKAAAEELAALLNETVIEIPAKAGEGGKLFGSITSRDILNKLKDEKDVEIDKRKIVLSEPIRQLGETEVLIRPFPEVEATLKVNVIAE